MNEEGVRDGRPTMGFGGSSGREVQGALHMADAPKLILGDDWKKPTGAGSGPAPEAKPAPAAGGSGLVVDSDWKSQAQAEKERLAAAEKKAAESGAGSRGAGGREERLPPADFTALVGTLVTQAFLYLGGFPDPETGRAIVSLEHAKFHIDLLAVLQTKTAGNLTPEEAEDLSRAVHELRLRFVDVSQAVAEMVKQRAAKGGVGGAGGAAGGPIAGSAGMPMAPPPPGIRR